MKGNYKLKLLSKKLKSGKCQIKFYVSSDEKKNMYGYLLAESNTTLREVVSKIENKVKSLDSANQYYQSHLYNLAKREVGHDQILIFNN